MNYSAYVPGLIVLARQSDFKYKLAAVVLDERDNPIADGRNARKTHPLQAKHAKKVKQEDKNYLHAEISALVKCRCKPYSILVIRVRNDSSLGMARPCDICLSAIVEAGISKIVYSDTNGNLIEETV